MLPNPLLQAEVDVLPEGTEVEVTWSGGNGPHRYTIVIINGQRHAANIYKDALYSVGEKPLTEVRIVK